MSSWNEPQNVIDDQAGFVRGGLRALPVAARGAVVNRTHRVIRERARAMQERRSRVRSLMVPMLLCAVLLTLSTLAVWTGLYQYQAVEAMEADVTALAAVDLSNHALVALLWFVPVSLAVLATVWTRRVRDNEDEEAR